VSDALVKNLIEERIDVAFRGPAFKASAASLRRISLRAWISILDQSTTNQAASLQMPACDIHLFDETSLIVFDRRVVIKSSSCALDGALALLWKLKEAKLERLVYQRHGFQISNYGGMREGLARLRSEVGDRLGAAVVAGETALFHPPPHGKRFGEGRVSLRILMTKLAPRIETALRFSNSEQREAALDNLELNSVFGSTVALSLHSRASSTMVWAVGESYASLQLLKKASMTFAVLEFDGTSLPGSRSGSGRSKLDHFVMRIQAALSPREMQIEAVHAGDLNSLPAVPGAHWQPQPLGASEFLSILSFDEFSSVQRFGRAAQA
jgi:hypothetical protein